MSEYVKGTCAVKDPESLVLALEEFGYTPEVHREPQVLYGYHGDARPEKAHVIVRRQQLGSASNDVGFLLKPDGTLEAIISEFDRSAKGLNDAWLRKLAMLSGVHRLMKKAKAMGRKVERLPADEKGRPRVRVYA
jgi:hypothetical protein